MLESKLHTSNYFDTFIEVADDTKVLCATIPPLRGGKMSVAGMQYELLHKHPYCYTSDDVFFQIYAERNAISPSEYESARKAFFSKGQACFRSSPLTKSYGFGVHCDKLGKVAIYGMETEAYAQFLHDPKIKKVKAMKSSRK